MLEKKEEIIADLNLQLAKCKTQKEDLKVKVREVEFSHSKLETRLQVKTDQVKEMQEEVNDLQVQFNKAQRLIQI